MRHCDTVILIDSEYVYSHPTGVDAEIIRESHSRPNIQQCCTTCHAPTHCYAHASPRMHDENTECTQLYISLKWQIIFISMTLINLRNDVMFYGIQDVITAWNYKWPSFQLLLINPRERVTNRNFA